MYVCNNCHTSLNGRITFGWAVLAGAVTSHTRRINGTACTATISILAKIAKMNEKQLLVIILFAGSGTRHKEDISQ